MESFFFLFWIKKRAKRMQVLLPNDDDPGIEYKKGTTWETMKHTMQQLNLECFL
jgi:hypothetical protein